LVVLPVGSQYECQSGHKQHTKSHHYNCDGVVSGNLEHRETPKISDHPVWSGNGRRWISSSRKRKTTFSASEAHCQDQDCSKLLSRDRRGDFRAVVDEEEVTGVGLMADYFPPEPTEMSARGDGNVRRHRRDKR
jgi:hypothetical protein